MLSCRRDQRCLRLPSLNRNASAGQTPIPDRGSLYWLRRAVAGSAINDGLTNQFFSLAKKSDHRRRLESEFSYLWN